MGAGEAVETPHVEFSETDSEHTGSIIERKWIRKFTTSLCFHWKRTIGELNVMNDDASDFW